MKPYWIKLKPEEIEELILQLAKKGLPPSKIGLVLRDSYGIPSVKAILGKSISSVLESKKVKVENEELKSLQTRIKRLEKHLQANPHDYTAKRGLQLTQAKADRLERYLKRKKR